MPPLFSPAQERLVDAAIDDILGWRQHWEAWQDAQRLLPLAEHVENACRDLQHVDASALRHLAASDGDLLDEGNRIVDSKWAEHIGMLARGEEGLHPRELCAYAWRRRLRRRVRQAAAHASAVLGLIGGDPAARRPSYSDPWSVARRVEMESRARAFLADHDIEDEDGKRVDLAEVARSSREARRAQWYSIVLGLQERAERDGFVHLFISCTLPAPWHSNPVDGDRTGYDPSLSPTAGARELSAAWHKALAMMVRRECQYYGVRVAEPHRDGCPHFHAGLWVRPSDVESVIACFAHHFPATTDDELAARTAGDFAKGPALVIKRWKEDGKSKASSYIMHYVLESLADQDDSEALPVRTWASDIGIRRISLVGLAPGTVGRWRAAFRMMKAGTDTDTDAVAGSNRTQDAIHALRRGQWATALIHLGAFDREAFRSVRSVRLDRWGDEVIFTVGWIAAGETDMTLVARLKRWEIVKKEGIVSIVVSYPRAAAAPQPGVPQPEVARPPGG